jgi:hypothetical protein
MSAAARLGVEKTSKNQCSLKFQLTREIVHFARVIPIVIKDSGFWL